MQAMNDWILFIGMRYGSLQRFHMRRKRLAQNGSTTPSITVMGVLKDTRQNWLLKVSFKGTTFIMKKNFH